MWIRNKYLILFVKKKNKPSISPLRNSQKMLGCAIKRDGPLFATVCHCLPLFFCVCKLFWFEHSICIALLTNVKFILADKKKVGQHLFLITPPILLAKSNGTKVIMRFDWTWSLFYAPVFSRNISRNCQGRFKRIYI